MRASAAGVAAIAAAEITSSMLVRNERQRVIRIFLTVFMFPSSFLSTDAFRSKNSLLRMHLSSWQATYLIKWSGAERDKAHIFVSSKLFRKLPVVVATGSCEPGRDLPSSVRSCSELDPRPV